MVTFIIPTYNSEKTISACLDSILVQNIEKEIIVVDNGSNDKTQVIIQEYPVKYLFEERQGPGAARNAALNKISKKSKYVVFIDSDVILPNKEWINHGINLLEKYTNIAAICGPAKPIHLTYISKSIGYLLYGKNFSREHRFNKIWTMGAIFKRSIIEKFRFDENYIAAAGEDIDLSFRIVKAGYEFLFSPELWIYHDHPTNLKQLSKKWYNYGKHYPRPYLENKVLNLGLYARIIYIPFLLLSLTLSFFLIHFKWFFLLLFFSLPFSYLIKTYNSSKLLELPIIIFIHTIKQYSQLIGIWVGIFHRITASSNILKKYLQIIYI